MLLRKATYNALLRRLRERYGAGFEAILYLIGFEVGKGGYEDHRRLLGPGLDTLLKAGSELFKALGYGALENLRFEWGETSTGSTIASSASSLRAWGGPLATS